MPVSGPEVRRPEVHAFFRRTFRLGFVPDRVPARVSADSRYVLYLNGREVFRGPIRSQPRRLYYDLLDLAPHLTTGENTLAVYVVYYGTARSFWIPATPNSTLGRSGVLVFEADLGAALEGSPDSSPADPAGSSPMRAGGRSSAMHGPKTGRPAETTSA